MLQYIQSTLLGTNEENTSVTREQLKESPERVKQAVDRFKEWYKYQPHLPGDELDPRFLIRNLGIDKFDEEKTKKRIEIYFTAKTFMPEFFQNRDPWGADVSKALESLELVILPTPTDEHYRISVIKCNIDNLEEYDVAIACACNFMLANLRLYLDSATKEIIIWDMANLTFKQITQAHLPSVQKIIYILQTCIAASIKNIHVINALPIAEFVISVAKKAMKKKVSDRLIVHSSMESFYEALPKKYLPKDMGGDEPLTLKEIATRWEKAIKTPEIRQWFLELENLRSDESKRLEKREFYFDDSVGSRGTFRQLELD